MDPGDWVTLDGNEAAAYVAHKTSEVIAIYPITPSSPMGESCDEWSSRGLVNLWGEIPRVVEMQSEGGAAGAVHGALQAGALTTTFTSSQGLLLMAPNLHKIAGELTPATIHVAARSLATHALSIFGDHADVYACRGAGWAMLFGASVQEVMDFALVAQAATLESRVPFLHVFDGFRTSHEVMKVRRHTDEVLRAMIDDDLVREHRARALSPDRPVLRGTAQNPDVFFFQGREAAGPYYARVPEIVERAFARFGDLTGRRYALYEYEGAPDAERVVVLMGSGCETAGETIQVLRERGDERIGLLKVRLYRPFDARRLVAAGADGLVLFNRFYQPDLDLDRFEAVPSVHLSRADEMLLPLRWTGILHGRVQADPGFSGGVHYAADALKAVAAGASVVLLVSEILRNGRRRIREIRDGMAEWLDEKEYGSVGELRGALSERNLPDPGALGRVNYLRALASWREA